MKKQFGHEVKGGEITFGYDGDKDGTNSLDGTIFLNEALQELIAKGQAKEDVKVVDFSFSGAEVVLVLDSDKDGEPLMKIKLNLGEALSESGLLK